MIVPGTRSRCSQYPAVPCHASSQPREMIDEHMPDNVFKTFCVADPRDTSRRTIEQGLRLMMMMMEEDNIMPEEDTYRCACTGSDGFLVLFVEIPLSRSSLARCGSYRSSQMCIIIWCTFRLCHLCGATYARGNTSGLLLPVSYARFREAFGFIVCSTTSLCPVSHVFCRLCLPCSVYLPTSQELYYPHGRHQRVLNLV